ncbi:TPA: hypothetical protein HA239_05190 [Candidatus Woesearchaeota archaeon]|nr:hypothetical protein QT06_C0001G0303 [archaeon GW2011_AR15]MBS3103622.1 hypothetical protein [Candidatus Woesearchaeota archaeon]HIH41778.1 hypothetical protein [Candidatus Woesearchaeota archaeon]
MVTYEYEGLQLLRRKPIKKGIIRQKYAGKNRSESVGNLEAVLIGAFGAIAKEYTGRIDRPAFTIGVREADSEEPYSIWRTGFVNHPEHNSIYTSPFASRYISFEGYEVLFSKIESANEVLELKQLFHEYFKAQP